MQSRIGTSRFLALIGLALAFSVRSFPAQADEARRAAFHQALQACATEHGLPPLQPGQKPTAENRQIMDQCLAAKGFAHPHGGHHHRHGADAAAAGTQ